MISVTVGKFFSLLIDTFGHGSDGFVVIDEVLDGLASLPEVFGGVTYD
jgi:hypothetical protein